MYTFYLLKPDMLQDKEALEFYKNFLYEQRINIIYEDEFNWINTAKILYEPSDINDIEKLRLIRKHMITTIKGYQMYYENVCVINLFNISEDRIEEFYDFKKKLRQKFVYNSDKYYISFYDKLSLDTEIKNINIESLSCKVVIKRYFETFYDANYSMAFFNRIHFPDPNPMSIEHDLRILLDNKNENKFLIKR